MERSYWGWKVPQCLDGQAASMRVTAPELITAGAVKQLCHGVIPCCVYPTLLYIPALANTQLGQRTDFADSQGTASGLAT